MAPRFGQLSGSPIVRMFTKLADALDFCEGVCEALGLDDHVVTLS